jgi:hypothetical protein
VPNAEDTQFIEIDFLENVARHLVRRMGGKFGLNRPPVILHIALDRACQEYSRQITRRSIRQSEAGGTFPMQASSRPENPLRLEEYCDF